MFLCSWAIIHCCNLWHSFAVLSHSYRASFFLRFLSREAPRYGPSLSFLGSPCEILSPHHYLLVDLLISHDAYHERLSPHAYPLVDLLLSRTTLLMRDFPSSCLFLNHISWWSSLGLSSFQELILPISSFLYVFKVILYDSTSFSPYFPYVLFFVHLCFCKRWYWGIHVSRIIEVAQWSCFKTLETLVLATLQEGWGTRYGLKGGENRRKSSTLRVDPSLRWTKIPMAGRLLYPRNFEELDGILKLKINHT